MVTPSFDVNDFPIETDQARIEVTLPTGTHVLELVVEDSAGLFSEPSRIVIVVEQGPPVITGITPNAGTQGVTFMAEITGENLLGLSAVTFQGSGVNAVILPGGTDSTAPIQITIAYDASLATAGFSVTTSIDVAQSPAGVTFEVQAAAVPPVVEPAIFAIEPAGAHQGERINVRIVGANLRDAYQIVFEGAGVTGDIVDSTSGTTLFVGVSIEDFAEPISRPYAVFTQAGRAVSPPNAWFNVLGRPDRVVEAVPTIIGIEPDFGSQGQQLFATIRGTNLVDVLEIGFDPPDIAARPAPGGTPESLPIQMDIRLDAIPGPHRYQVRTPLGGAASPADAPFTVGPLAGDYFFEGSRSVTEVSGIGAAREERLAQAGITDLAQLAAADPEFVARVLSVLLAVATGYVTEAQNLLRLGAP